MKRILIVALALFVGSSVLYAAGPSAEFDAAVKAMSKDFTAALSAKDAAKVGSYYAKDAIAFPPNADMVQGRDAIQAYWKGLIDAGMAAQLEVVEAEDDGNLGAEVGKYRIVTADGKTVDQGKYVVVWKKQDGAWKLYRDIWNTSMPAPASK